MRYTKIYVCKGHHTTLLCKSFDLRTMRTTMQLMRLWPYSFQSVFIHKPNNRRMFEYTNVTIEEIICERK